MQDAKMTKEQKDNEQMIKFKGRYVNVIGRRKTAVAQVRMYKRGNGLIMVNGKKVNHYFTVDQATIVRQPLKATGHLRDLNFSVVVRGGGERGQAEAVRHGLSRALVEYNEDLKQSLKAKGWLSRDARKKERKKPGLKKARRAPQWSKR